MTTSVDVSPDAGGGEISRRSFGAWLGATTGFFIGPTSIIAPPIGLFMVPVAAQFGLDRATFPLIMLMTASCAALVSPLAGRAIDRFGVRRVIIPALLLSGLVQIGLSFTGGALAAYLSVMVCVGILAGVQNPIAYTKVLAQWFRTKRGLMVALAAAIGSGGGGILVPQIVERCIQSGGWQLGYAGLGIFVLIGSPLVILLLKEPRGAATREAGATRPLDTPGVSLGSAVRSVPFWLILIALMFGTFSLSALAVHVPAWAFDGGGGPQVAAAFLSIFSLGSVVGQLGSGLMLDRIQTAKVGMPFFLIASLGTSLLLVIGPSSPWVAPNGFLIGMALGAELGLASYLVSRYFGLRSYGQVYGCIYGAMVLGSGSGTVLMGLMYEMVGDYTLGFSLAAGALLLSALAIFALPKYRFAVSPLAEG